ncbi:ABC transporter substrate-binding protein [Arthrobacter subterraneus]|uniref:ABC transporter substrate-binding protein n=1 Tax=Arthrobacter subterraneus TaxID=335973 RepID=UPI00382598C7
MPEAVDVGSVLGGRYKVTAYVLASAEKDLVLDGVDQVLNRPVSILVASVSNASQVATSAREVATGERPGNIQVLDLGITDAGTYLVTNRAPAADLLDLVIQQDAPYIEPFFTDTLGSEIFGVARSTEPETYEDDDYYDDHHHEPERRPSRLPKARMPRFGRGAAAGAAAAGGAAAGAAAASARSEQGTAPQGVTESRPAGNKANVPPPPSAPPRTAPGEEQTDKPRISAWTGDDSDRSEDSRSSQRPASRFPAAAAGGGAAAAGTQYDDDVSYQEYDDVDDRENSPRFTRLLVGLILALVIVGAVILAVTQLRPLFDPPVASESTTAESTTEATEGQTTSPSATDSATPEPELVAPVATGVTRLVPDNPELNSQTDADLGAIIDDNPASFWGSLVYANETFGGLAQNLALVVELEEPSNISEIQIEQLNSSGGSFTVLLNDQPTLEGATQVAQSGFTGPSVTFNVPEADGAPPTAQYVIVNFTQLPRLSNVQAQYPWGMRIAEINIS